MTQIPKSLIHVGNRQRALPNAKALFYFEDSPNQALEIFNKPFRFSLGNYGISIVPEGVGGMRMDNLGWYVRESYERGDSLWAMFSRESVMSELRDSKGKIYEVNCNQTFALLSKGIDTSNAYFLIDDSKKGFKDAIYFGASELLIRLSHEDSTSFPKTQIKRLADFFYEDCRTMKHSEKSRQIGQEADSIFFPA